MTPRIINAAGLALIEKWEGLVLTAGQDIAGVLTIGYGHTLGVYEGETITEAQADALLANDLAIFEEVVTIHTIGVPTDNQFAAMVSLSFNIGAAS
jgi:lysozyme